VSNLLSQVFRFILKLVFGLSAAVLAVGLLLVALTVLALSLLKSLITGRKPAPLMAFARFQQFSQQGMWPSQSRQGSAKAASGQVVDVEVREIPDDRRQP
jgi:hypothetical protein